MAVSIAKLAIGISANTKGLTQGLSSAQGAVSGFGGSIAKLAQQLGGSMAGQVAIGNLLADTIRGLTSQVISLATRGFGFLVSEVKNAFNEIDGMAKMSDRLGVSMESLAGLQLGADLSGVENLEGAMEKFANTASEAAKGTGDGVKAFKEMGLFAKELMRLAPDKQMERVADALQGFGKGDQIRLITDLFGRGNVDMQNFLASGSEGLAAMNARAQELGLSISRVDAAKVEMANDAVTEFWGSIKGVARTFAVELSPFVTALAKQLTDLVVSFDAESFASGMIDAVETVSLGIAVTMDFVEKLGLSVAATFTDAFAQIVFEVETILKLASRLNQGLPKKMQSDWADVLLSSVKPFRQGMDKSLGDMEARLHTLDVAPRAGAVRTFFDETRRIAQENAEKMAEAGAAAGMGVGNDIAAGFQRGLNALEFGSKEAFSAIVNAIAGGTQQRAATQLAEIRGAEAIAAMGGVEGVIPDADLAAAGAGLRAQAPDAFINSLDDTYAAGRAATPPSGDAMTETVPIWKQILEEIQNQTVAIKGQTKLSPAAI